MSKPRSFSQTQIAVHWLIAVLVLFQYALHQEIVGLWSARVAGTIADAPVPTLHAITGIVIVLLTLWRLALVARNGLPPLPKNTSTTARRVVRGIEALFYFTLIAMPVSGGIAWYAGIAPVIGVHDFFTVFLVIVTVAHIGSAVFQQFFVRNNVPRRMFGLL